ncbi:MAG: radical SAM protein [Pseudobutyrivibrio sp.]|uniref:radical SAM/SPASM domain-containing protein n=1 Tax=Pseudobutyrivibrio sp. TaxID=2014367 RepID=UPI0025ED614B|nr:radical SAM protein [Pseudobutyrivibrio sp.]MBQ8488766.1 radical SAM protein [Pseudobutyrivibrio sp.]
MKIYGFDEKFLMLKNNEGLNIIYSTYLNKIFGLDNRGVDLFSKLITRLEAHDGDDCNVDSDMKELLRVLLLNEILFDSFDNYKKADFKNIYQNYRKFIPHKAYIHLTQRCNLNCTYCYDKDNIGKTRELTTKQWKEIIISLKEHGFDYLVFTGGEIMLRNDISELVLFANKNDFKVHLMTNSTIKIDSKIVEAAYHIDISLDAIDEIENAKTRKNSKSFNILNNIMSYEDKYRKKITIKPVVSCENENLYADFKEFFISQGFHSVDPLPLQPTKRNEKCMYPTSYLQMSKHSFDAYFKIAKCNACYEVIAINSDGNIFPCQAMINDVYCLGNIFDSQWFEKIEKNKITKLFMDNDVTTDSHCVSCSYKYICGGPCKAVCYNKTGDILSMDEDYCKYAKLESKHYLETINFEER